MITGQIVLRDSSATPPGDDTGRKIMMVVGVIAVPPELNLKGEHKYTIAGTPSGGIESLYKMMDPGFGKLTENFEEINFTLLPETGEDLTDVIHGAMLGNILLKPIWRV